MRKDKYDINQTKTEQELWEQEFKKELKEKLKELRFRTFWKIILIVLTVIFIGSTTLLYLLSIFQHYGLFGF